MLANGRIGGKVGRPVWVITSDNGVEHRASGLHMTVLLFNYLKVCMLKILAALFLVFVPAFAPACTMHPDFKDLGAFLDAERDDKVIFLGTVKSIHKSRADDWTITFATDRWWRGVPRTLASVSGGIGTMALTSCAGVHDFAVEEGEQWLIVGTAYKERIDPTPWLSIRLENKKLPIEVEQQLNKLTKQ